jgi:hypothetical protein
MCSTTMERRDHCQSALNGERISARMLVWCTAEVAACGGNERPRDGGQRAWRVRGE